MGAIKDYLHGVSTKGICGECSHGATAVPGCACRAEWCPCHKAYYGHGAHGCIVGRHKHES